jgi:hypothetical protein
MFTLKDIKKAATKTGKLMDSIPIKKPSAFQIILTALLDANGDMEKMPKKF